MIISIPVSIRIIPPDAFDAATAQTAGSQRLAAVTRSSGLETGLWGGLLSIAPGCTIDVHHHGAQETIAFLLEGVSHLRWGEHGEFSGIARAGDFLHIPPFLLHMETNPSSDTPVRWVVVDKRYGSYVNHDLAEHHVVVHADIPDIDAIFLPELDSESNPKSKGVGELGICGAGAALANAIHSVCGARVRDYLLATLPAP